MVLLEDLFPLKNLNSEEMDDAGMAAFKKRLEDDFDA